MAKKNTSSGRRVTKKAATTKKSVPVGQWAQLDWSWAERTSVRLVGLFVIGVLVGGFVLSGLQRAGADQLVGSQGWRYSRLSITPERLNWTTPGEEYVAKTPEDLYRQITKSNPPGDPVKMTALQITNVIGSRGWELISVNRSKDRRQADDYWFRRSSR